MRFASDEPLAWRITIARRTWDRGKRRAAVPELPARLYDPDFPWATTAADGARDPYEIAIGNFPGPLAIREPGVRGETWVLKCLPHGGEGPSRGLPR